MTQVLCVLKSGGDFLPKHAARLYDQFLGSVRPGVDFLCLTDQVAEVDALEVPATALPHLWPAWWSKMNAFAVAGPCLYLDLDVNIVGDLDRLIDVARATDFAMCRDFWGMVPHGVNSSVMAWRGDLSFVVDAFAARADEYMKTFNIRERWGDQAFVRDLLGLDGIPVIQDLAPGAVLSFKRDLLRGVPLGDACVVVSHAQPRPWDPGGADAWLKLKRGGT